MGSGDACQASKSGRGGARDTRAEDVGQVDERGRGHATGRGKCGRRRAGVLENVVGGLGADGASVVGTRMRTDYFIKDL